MATIADVYVKQYAANVYTLAQQKRSKFRNAVTGVDMKGDVRYLERVAPTSAVLASISEDSGVISGNAQRARYADSPIIETVFSRRALFANEYVWGDMVDWRDDLNVLIDPTSDVTKAGAMALARTIDDIIITEMLGNAHAGVSGGTAVALPDTQKIAATVGDTSQSPANTGFNLAKLIAARSLFGKSDYDLDDPENQLFLAISQQQLDDLLLSLDVQSPDYTAVRAIYDGLRDTFMGFKFILSNKLPLNTTTGVRSCIAWVKGGVVFAEPQPVSAHIAERPDKNFNWYAHMKMKVGATRMDETAVVEIACQDGEPASSGGSSGGSGGSSGGSAGEGGE